MVKADVLRKRLEKFDEYMTILERAKTYSWEELESNPERYGSVERFLQLAVENMSDMANHIIAEESWGKVDYSRDIP